MVSISDTRKKVILLIVPDLVARTTIKGAISKDDIEVLSIRTLEELQLKLNEYSYTSSLSLIIDLNHLTLDPFIAISQTLGKIKDSNIISFYSHVNHELRERAESLGIMKVYPRSKFFNCIAELVN